MDLEPVLRTAQRSQGVVTWGQLLSEHPRRRIEAAVDAGLLVRVGRGRLSLPNTPDPLRQALVHRGVVSHAAAARLWFLETLHEPVTTDVTVPRGATSRPVASGTRLHWTDLEADEVRGRVTSPLRTVVDCARTMPFAEALTVADSALRRRAVEKDELVHAARSVRGPGAGAARRVAEAADHRSMSPLESGLRGIVLERGMFGFRPAAAVPDNPAARLRRPGRSGTDGSPWRRRGTSSTDRARRSTATAGGTTSSSARAGWCCASRGTR